MSLKILIDVNKSVILEYNLECKPPKIPSKKQNRPIHKKIIKLFNNHKLGRSMFHAYLFEELFLIPVVENHKKKLSAKIIKPILSYSLALLLIHR